MSSGHKKASKANILHLRRYSFLFCMSEQKVALKWVPFPDIPPEIHVYFFKIKTTWTDLMRDCHFHKLHTTCPGICHQKFHTLALFKGATSIIICSFTLCKQNMYSNVMWIKCWLSPVVKRFDLTSVKKPLRIVKAAVMTASSLLNSHFPKISNDSIKCLHFNYFGIVLWRKYTIMNNFR